MQIGFFDTQSKIKCLKQQFDELLEAFNKSLAIVTYVNEILPLAPLSNFLSDYHH